MTKDSFVAEVNFYFGVSTTTTSCFKMYSLCKMWKSLLIMLLWHCSHPNFALILRAKFISFFLVCIFLYSDWIWREIFGLNMEIYGINLHIQYEYRKTWTRKNCIWTLLFTQSGDHTHFVSFANFQQTIYSININNLCCNPVENCFNWAHLA